MGKDITLSNVTKRYNGDTILENLSLTILGGTFFALLGPSGSGKTTILRLIAGFEQPDSGNLLLGDHDITHMPIHERKVNTVFQHYALFPHMNVFDNIAYGLTIRKLPKDLIIQKVTMMVERVGLQKHIFKQIHQLSGGQKQRVAWCRAIINEPDVLLLDEPLAALDVSWREQMLLELIELQDSLKTTFVYVTHDQSEALTVADSMAIMNQDGAIEQVGSPKDIYEFPRTSFVANFVGKTNIFDGYIDLSKTGCVFVTDQGKQCLIYDRIREEMDVEALEAIKMMGIRPEKIKISKKKLDHYDNVMEGAVVSIIYFGRSTQYNVVVNGGKIFQIFEQNEKHFIKDSIDYDDVVYLHWQKDTIVLLAQ
ncbi:MAG: ABC transporter ATP-binding protein [Candidatus Babeliales bacterium]